MSRIIAISCSQRRVENLAALPPKMDLRPQCPKEAYDQGQLGSCSAKAIAGALEFDQMKQAVKVFTASRLFIYYNERAMEGTVKSDSGAQIRDGIKSVGSIALKPTEGTTSRNSRKSRRATGSRESRDGSGR